MTNLQEVIDEEAAVNESEEVVNDTEPSVIDHLDNAVLTAEKQGMQMSELIGMFFYYAHNLSQEARNTAAAEEDNQGQIG